MTIAAFLRVALYCSPIVQLQQATTHIVTTPRDGTRAFTTNIAAMSVRAIDVAGRGLRATFPVGPGFDGVGYAPRTVVP